MKMSAFQIRALQCFEALRGSGGTDRLQGVVGLPWQCPPTRATKTSQKETVGSEGPGAGGSEKRLPGLTPVRQEGRDAPLSACGG